MINRVYCENCLSFKKVDLEFDKGLNVFTGPSGAGKSILIQAILALFSKYDVKSSLSEIELCSFDIKEDAYDLQSGDDIIIKAIKKDKVRYFLNNQTISKKNLDVFSSKLIKYLNLKDTSDFESSKLLDFLDRLSMKQDKKYKDIKVNFDDTYKKYMDSKKLLEKLLEDEKKIEELKEFVSFEIEKIESINPSIDEYDELSEVKKRLSKKEKIQEAIENAKPIFQYTSRVSSALEILELDSTFFDETINELNNIFEKANDSLDELEDIDIENILDRIEKLSNLQKKFGSIKEALEYKQKKKEELERYENITFEKVSLEKKLQVLEKEIQNLAKQISTYRKKSAKTLEEKMNYYLKFLYLSDAKIVLKDKNIDASGCDIVEFYLDDVSLDTISSGEFNRLRLSLLTAMSEYEIAKDGVLFLDEIDANLSGKESEAIAKVLKKLSLSYQIFAISHQPQLTSNANQHFLVYKEKGISEVRLLNKDERIEEIARMISGEQITQEALSFAKNLFL